MKQLRAWEFEDDPSGDERATYRLQETAEKRRPLDLCRNGKPIDDVAKEYLERKVLRVLEFFLRSGGRVFSRRELRLTLWPDASEENGYRSLDAYLTTLRTLLKDDPDCWSADKTERWRIIKTVFGRGLRFGPEVTSTEVFLPDHPNDQIESLDASASSNPSFASLSTSPTTSQIAMQLLAEIQSRRPDQTTCNRYVLEEQGLVVGRDQEITIARDRWLKDRKRPLLIYGPPGIGKSTLALAVLQDSEVVRRFGARRYRLRCDDLSTVSDVIGRIGDKWFGLPLPVAELDVTSKLSEGPCAVLLDNYEMPLRGADFAAGQDFLAKLLGVKELWLIVGIQGHASPRGVHWAEPLEPRRFDIVTARELFCSITGQAYDKSDSRLDSLLGDMDGVPHAIELLASQAKHYPNIEPIVVRWNHEQTALLRSGRAESRAENIEVAYEFAILSPLLSSDDRKLLRILASLPAGIADDDLDKIMDGGLKAAGALRGATLAFHDGGRLRMLSPLRKYVSKVHNASQPEKQQAINLFLAVAGYVEGTDCTKLSTEYPNAIWALSEALSKRRKSAINTAIAFGTFSLRSGVGQTESAKLMDAAGDLARRTRHKKDEARCIVGCAEIAYIQKTFEVAKGLYERAIKLHKADKDQGGEARCIRMLADIANLQNRPENANDLYQEASELSKAVGDKGTEARCISGRGEIALTQNRFSEAEELYDEAIRLHSVAHNNEDETLTLLARAELALKQNKFVEAARFIERARTLSRVAGDKGLEAMCIWRHGFSARLQGNFGEAERLYAEASDMFKAAGIKVGEARCILGRGIIARLQNKLDEAEHCYETAQTLFEAFGDERGAADCIAVLTAHRNTPRT